MAIIGKVLRMHHREKKSVREIARATSLARNTVRKVLRRGTAELPQYRRPAVSTKLSPYLGQLHQALAADARRPKKERRTAKALFTQLQAPPATRAATAGSPTTCATGAPAKAALARATPMSH